jgi:outer membrane protein assembly factor BamE (lipoprotein component of BamABCDE complex)
MTAGRHRSAPTQTRIAKSHAFGNRGPEFRRMTGEGAAEFHGRTLRRRRPVMALSLLIRFGLCAGLAFSLAGCLGYDGDIVHGYQIDPKLLDQVKIGSSAEQALVVMGTPSTTSTVGGDAWYYITQKTDRSMQFMDPQIVDQHVLAIYFDKNKKVTRLANYGLKDGKLYDFVSRTTPTGGADSALLTGMFKTLLRFD